MVAGKADRGLVTALEMETLIRTCAPAAPRVACGTGTGATGMGIPQRGGRGAGQWPVPRATGGLCGRYAAGSVKGMGTVTNLIRGEILLSLSEQR